MDALEGRRQVTAAAIARIRATAAAEAEARLRQNPTFRKQVLAEARAGRNGPGNAGGGDPAGLPDPADELGPELLAGHAAGAPPPSMDSWLRRRLR
jgi:hypothetical protein